LKLGQLKLVLIVFLGELHIPQELGVHSLHLNPLLGGRLPRGVTMMLPVLIVVGMIL